MSSNANGKVWKTLPLIEVATLQRGFDLPVQNRVSGEVPIFAANGPVGFHNQRKFSGPGVVTGRSGSIGKVHYVEGDYWPLNTSLFVKDFHGNWPRFIFYLLKHLGLANYCEGTGVPTLNRNNVHKVPVPLPPLPEQKRIAEILDRAEALRAKRRAALALLDELTQSIFLDMFGDPVTNPKGWPTKTFKDLGTLDRGISKNRPRNSPHLLGGSHPLIQTGDIANSGGYIRKFVSTYSDAGLKQSKKWPSGTLCITIAANIAKTGILTFEACFPDSVVGFKSDPATVEYARVWLSFLQKTLEDAAPESAQKNINLGTLRKLPIPTPPQNLRTVFASRISSAEELKGVERRGLEELDGLFASLQHRAFRGEL